MHTQVIFNKILTASDLDALNEAEIKRRKRHINTEWISFEYKLPQLNEKVIICHRAFFAGPEIETGSLVDPPRWAVNGRRLIETEAVTHWMPLPKLPSGAEKEEK